MLLEEFWTWLEMQPLAAHIGETAWFPFLESVHVLSAMFVVGTVLMADLRLLGWSARRYPVTVVTSEVVPWTWGAFVIATVTGVGTVHAARERVRRKSCFSLEGRAAVARGREHARAAFHRAARPSACVCK